MIGDKETEWELMKKGEHVTFIGCSSTQIRWGNNDDPNPVLEEGSIYIIEDVKAHSSHTKIKLIGYSGWYNSVCFYNNSR